MRELTFYKTIEGRWYILLPEWEGDISDLEMVCGADTMLDILAQGENRVEVLVYTEEPEYHDTLLTLDKVDDTGGYYTCNASHMLELPVWLCNVTLFVMGEFPEKIYINKL